MGAMRSVIAMAVGGRAWCALTGGHDRARAAGGSPPTASGPGMQRGERLRERREFSIPGGAPTPLRPVPQGTSERPLRLGVCVRYRRGGWIEVKRDLHRARAVRAVEVVPPDRVEAKSRGGPAAYLAGIKRHTPSIPVRVAFQATGAPIPPANGFRRLPAIVGERLVRLRHPVDVVLALVGVALLLLGVEQLVGEPLGHRLLAPLARELDEPAHR